jgi:hypothetical protein
MRTPSQYFALVRQMGPAWVLYRISHAVQRRSGLLRRAAPATPWEQMPAPALALHVRKSLQIAAVAGGDACVDEAEKILAGKFRLFSHREVAAGFPPDWQRNWLVSGAPTEANQSAPLRHWTKISDASCSDIKGVWELSRFSWAFPLVRAHARTGDPRFAEAFWRLFRDWCDRNPPNLGSNWMCGQESTFRLMAVVFAAENLGVPDAERMGLARFVVATGRRIAAHLAYALSQKNNHGISECIGLITVSGLLPGHVESPFWRAAGRRHLRRQLGELVYPDGSFSQHSLVYHRLLLHDLVWCATRLRGAGEGIPDWLAAPADRALDFLRALTEPATGLAPLFGSNDGARILPLVEEDFLDFRSVVQLASAVFRQELPLPAGPWDEAVAWLAGAPDSFTRVPWPDVPERWRAAAGGYVQLRTGADRLFLRCPERFRHRPSQADLLHVDVTLAGRPFAHDGGTYSYNSTERFVTLTDATAHNVLMIDGREPMQKMGRFLYLPWPHGRVEEIARGIAATHDGYTGLNVRWVREVTIRPAGGFFVRDRVQGAKGRHLRWNWRLADGAWLVEDDRVESSETLSRGTLRWRGLPAPRVSLVRGSATTAGGWWSAYYGAVGPACSLIMEAEPTGDVDVVFEFLPPS